MKTVLITIALLFCYTLSPIKFTSSKTHDFGEIKVNTKNEHSFEFINDSKETIKILNVTTTCGCTVAEYSKEVKPGEKGFIKASYQAPDHTTIFKKYITVFTNTEEQFIKLTIYGKVIE